MRIFGTMIKHNTSTRFNINLNQEKLKFNTIKRLASDCLRFKWIEDQKRNLKRVLSPCAYCFDYKIRNIPCDLCLIDKDICNNDGNSGLIGYILSKYGNSLLKDISSEDYNLVRISLEELKITGIISKQLKTKIRKKFASL